MNLFPAIDLLGGRVVRLRQGDYDDTTFYGDDPVATAVRFVDEGAAWVREAAASESLLPELE